MNSRPALCVVAAAMCFMASCTPWRQSYLQNGLDHLTKDSVTVRLGPPGAERRLDSGGTVWQYRYTGSRVTSNQYGVYGGSRCTAYNLVFDGSGVLRQVTRQRC